MSPSPPPPSLRREGFRPPGAGPPLVEALQRHLGHSEFRPGQEALVRAVLAGRDALGILPTGGGKSVCFQLPAFLLPGMVLVVSPLISLMEDQTLRARRRGLAADYLTSTLPVEKAREVWTRAAEGRTRLLFVAPERLEVPSFRLLLDRVPLSLVAVDEAHCISQWGHDFRPSYLRIGKLRQGTAAPFLAVTATATPRTRQEIARWLGLRDPLVVVGTFDRPNLHWEVVQASSHRQKLGLLFQRLATRRGATIVYASTRRAVEAVRRDLARSGLAALSYHAALPAALRTRVQERFLEDPAPVVVATNAFGMGIDRADVRMVLHYQLPGSLEAYYQEAGRAGRDGEEARCMALYGPRDRGVHEGFLAAAYPEPERLRRLWGALQRAEEARGEGEITSLSLESLRRALGGKLASREVVQALQALARSGALELLEGEEGEAPPTRVRVRLTAEHPPWQTLAVLREAARRRLEAVERYALEKSCRRRALLSYFGESRPEAPCQACDRCRPEFGARRSLLGWLRDLCRPGRPS